MTLWCNGSWVEESGFPMSPTDRGHLLGLGLFETMLGLDGRVVFADRHLARLRAGCVRLGWEVFPEEMEERMVELLDRNGLTDGRARVRLAVTGGSGGVGGLAAGGDRLVWMLALPAVDAPASVAVNVSPWVRNERSALAGLKCASYAENVAALDAARGEGFGETLFFNGVGNLCEAAASNVFLVRDGRLATPSLESGCLPGVTRAVVIEEAGGLGIECEERWLVAEDLDGAEELFLTSSTRGLTDVSRVGARRLAGGRTAERLRVAWNAAIRRKDGC